MNSPGCDHNGQNTNSVYGKLAALKITNVLYSNKYCCICLETSDGQASLDTCGVVDGGEKNLMILTLREMLEAMFDDTVLHILRDSSNHICPVCTDSIQQTLSFIQKTKTHALIFAKYFTTLNRLSGNLLQLGDTENLGTVVLNASLDDIRKDIESANDVQSEGAKRKKEDESPRVRKKAKLAEGREIRIETVDVEKEESDMVVGVNTEGHELVVSDKTPCNNDKDNQELRQNSEPTAPVTKQQMDKEKRNVHSGSQDEVAMSDLINKRTKILHLKQGVEDRVLNAPVLPIKDTGIIQEQIDGNIESGSTDTEQIIQEIEVHSSDEPSTDKNVNEQALHTGLRIVCVPNQLDTSNNLDENNLIEKEKPDATDGSDVPRKVFTGILKKGYMTSKKQPKSVRFGECPTLSDWRKEFISGNTDLNENAKIDAEAKTSEETKENEIISVNKDDVNIKRKDVDTPNSKSSSSRLVRKGLFNRPIRRDVSIVLTDILKNRNVTSLQMPISVYDDRHKNIITNLNKDKIVSSEHQKPVDSATGNVVVNEITAINETDVHKGLENTGLKVTLQTDLPKTNQEPSLTCKERSIIGIMESTKVAKNLLRRRSYLKLAINLNLHKIK